MSRPDLHQASRPATKRRAVPSQSARVGLGLPTNSHSDIGGIDEPGVVGNAPKGFGGPLPVGARRSIGQLVHDRLRSAILNAELLPGTSVSEAELAARLYVSRTPVREALQRLVAERLVQVIPQVGSFVTCMDLKRIREALFLRESVECAAILRFSRPLSSGDAKHLQAVVKRHLVAAEEKDIEAVLSNDDAFHEKLLEFAGMAGVWRYVRDARETHLRVRVLAHSEFDSARRSAKQHGAVVAELVAGRADGAAMIMRDHIRMNEQFAVEIAQRFPTYFLPTS